MTRLVLAGVGILAMGYAVVGALTDPGERLAGHLVFLVALQAAHDLVLLPLAIGVGALVRRFTRGRVRAVVQGALIVAVAVVVVGLPLAFGPGPGSP
jgi:hypothetical protein